MSYDVPIYIFIALIVICMRQDVGRGFGGFLDLCEKIFFLKRKPGGRHNPPQVEFYSDMHDFYYYITSRNVYVPCRLKFEPYTFLLLVLSLEGRKEQFPPSCQGEPIT